MMALHSKNSCYWCKRCYFSSARIHVIILCDAHTCHGSSHTSTWLIDEDEISRKSQVVCVVSSQTGVTNCVLFSVVAALITTFLCSALADWWWFIVLSARMRSWMTALTLDKMKRSQCKATELILCDRCGWKSLFYGCALLFPFTSSVLCGRLVLTAVAVWSACYGHDLRSSNYVSPVVNRGKGTFATSPLGSEKLMWLWINLTCIIFITLILGQSNKKKSIDVILELKILHCIMSLNYTVIHLLTNIPIFSWINI